MFAILYRSWLYKCITSLNNVILSRRLFLLSRYFERHFSEEFQRRVCLTMFRSYGPLIINMTCPASVHHSWGSQGAITHWNIVPNFPGTFYWKKNALIFIYSSRIYGKTAGYSCPQTMYSWNNNRGKFHVLLFFFWMMVYCLQQCNI